MKKLFSAMAVLVLAAASAVPVPNNTVSGKIIDWPAGETGTLRLAPLAGGMTLVSAAIDAAGNFKLTLPDPPERGLVSVADLFSPASSVRTNCRGSGTAAPDDGQVQVFYLNVLKNGQSFGDVTYDNFPTMLPRPDSVSGTLLYFSKPTRLDGEVTCGPDLSDMVLRGEFPAGWQLVLTEVRPGKTVDSALETYRPELAGSVST